MVRLSVNVNKIATVRNSRGGDQPSVLAAVDVCIAAGAQGITVHPRADARHITYEDVRAVAKRLAEKGVRPRVEYNIEGDPDPQWLALVKEVRPDQATLVPVRPGEITSEAGWPLDTDRAWLRSTVQELQALGIRVSLFVDASVPAIEFAKQAGADRVELYTEPFAARYAAEPSAVTAILSPFKDAALRAHALGLGVNAGHDLSLQNLAAFCGVPHLDEVSIGHAIVSRAIFVGLGAVVKEYLAVLGGRE